jgi:methyl-accepting chemotaxis protein
MILNAGESMRDIARRVSTAVSEQGLGGKQIAEAAENVAARAGMIAAATGEQRAVSRDMVDSVQLLQELPRLNEKRAEVMATTVRTLAERWPC